MSPGFVVLDESALTSDATRHIAWRRWLWLFNLFQTLRGVLLATRSGLDAGDHQGISIAHTSKPATGGGSASHAGGWDEVISQSMQALKPGLQMLRDSAIPIPNEVGYELAEGEEVVAEAELAWTQKRVVLLMPHHLPFKSVWETHGWTTVVAEGDWATFLGNSLTAAPFSDEQAASNNQP